MKRPVLAATAAQGAVVPARRGLHATLRRTAAIATQVSALVSLWFVSDAVVRWLHLPLPAGVVGLMLLLGLLLSGRFAPRWIKSGADWMLSEMLLFFVPAAVAIIQYGHLIENDGVRLALVVVPGTLLVMCATALAVEFGVRLERGLLLRRLRRARQVRDVHVAQALRAARPLATRREDLPA
ncbi:MAG: CidA/LrgA family protein [Janthinobacterium lividum]